MIGWLDCAAGASGDMFLGVLVDAGVPLATLQAAVDAIGVEPIELRVSTVERHGIGATQVAVHTAEAPAARHWGDIRRLVERAGIPGEVRETALDAFARLARAEAAVHRVAPEDVHFHEVGALDAIADMVGTAAGLHALGLERLTASPVTLGSGGTARSGHGVIPVPAPAVLALLAEAGAPVRGGPAPYEMCTPTGAALLAATVTGWGPLPGLVPSRTGVGAGGRDPAELPNVLRLVLGEESQPAQAVVLETNVDDLDPRLWPDVLDRLLAAGASDAWLSPILMKKGRPAHTLHALCPHATVAAVRAEIFRRTSTLGVREVPVGKTALQRETGAVTVGGERIATKRALLDGRLVNVSVEFEDVRRAADVLGLPVKEVLRAATSAAYEQ
ncbi:MAG TPA: nickel pincer cofactor biosynthesis protein LarC [Mycobacteriales bacterium]|nr:nickel pincer cofactor biosynthesis protein LarC [Mycobacteriales bacterium]